MKMQVITDTEGNIVATGHLESEGKDSPSMARVLPGVGQQYFEVEVKKDIAMLEPMELHNRYRIQETGVVGKLVEQRKTRSQKGQ